VIPSTAADSKIAEFLRTMPAAYARAFVPSEVAEHEKIVVRRGARLVHAEICGGSSGEQICIVAEDRPGLLVLVTDALLVHGLSIRNARVFRRLRADGRAEAIDFLQLRHSRSEAGVGAVEIGAFLQTLGELVAEDMLAASRPSSPPPSGVPATRVYFELERRKRDEATLLVDAPDTEGLLNAVTNALAAQSVHILACEICAEGGVAHARFELISSASQAFTAIRLCDIQQAVHAALPKFGRR